MRELPVSWKCNLQRLSSGHGEISLSSACSSASSLTSQQYCSKPCQTAHWSIHKRDCKFPLKSPDCQPNWMKEHQIPAHADIDEYGFVKNQTGTASISGAMCQRLTLSNLLARGSNLQGPAQSSSRAHNLHTPPTHRLRCSAPGKPPPARIRKAR